MTTAIAITIAVAIIQRYRFQKLLDSRRDCGWNVATKNHLSMAGPTRVPHMASVMSYPWAGALSRPLVVKPSNERGPALGGPSETSFYGAASMCAPRPPEPQQPATAVSTNGVPLREPEVCPLL
jgi:hypothetical protein